MTQAEHASYNAVFYWNDMARNYAAKDEAFTFFYELSQKHAWLELYLKGSSLMQ